MELQGSQQADRFEHLCNVHLQTALQLDEEPADLWVDLAVLWPEMSDSRKFFSYTAGGTFTPIYKMFVYAPALKVLEISLKMMRSL